MIVVDASTVLELLLNTTTGECVAERLLDPAETLLAPDLLDVEVLQVLRRYVLAGDMSARRGRQAVDDLGDLPITRYPAGPFLQRIWALRRNVTAYDAAYVALAEATGAPLLTGDQRLAAAPGHKAVIELV